MLKMIISALVVVLGLCCMKATVIMKLTIVKNMTMILLTVPNVKTDIGMICGRAGKSLNIALNTTLKTTMFAKYATVDFGSTNYFVDM